MTHRQLSRAVWHAIIYGSNKTLSTPLSARPAPPSLSETLRRHTSTQNNSYMHRESSCETHLVEILAPSLTRLIIYLVRVRVHCAHSQSVVDCPNDKTYILRPRLLFFGVKLGDILRVSFSKGEKRQRNKTTKKV